MVPHSDVFQRGNPTQKSIRRYGLQLCLHLHNHAWGHLAVSTRYRPLPKPSILFPMVRSAVVHQEGGMGTRDLSHTPHTQLLVPQAWAGVPAGTGAPWPPRAQALTAPHPSALLSHSRLPDYFNEDNDSHLGNSNPLTITILISFHYKSETSSLTFKALTIGNRVQSQAWVGWGPCRDSRVGGRGHPYPPWGCLRRYHPSASLGAGIK